MFRGLGDKFNNKIRQEEGHDRVFSANNNSTGKHNQL